jgi:hypothetical protein
MPHANPSATVVTFLPFGLVPVIEQDQFKGRIGRREELFTLLVSRVGADFRNGQSRQIERVADTSARPSVASIGHQDRIGKRAHNPPARVESAARTTRIW